MDQKLSERLARVADESTLRLTHHGRKTGKPYEVTIWFMVEDDRILLITNTDRDWARNVMVHPKVLLRIRNETFSGEARLIEGEERDHVFDLVQRKYWYAIPYIWTMRALMAVGVMADTAGAFEVKVAG